MGCPTKVHLFHCIVIWLHSLCFALPGQQVFTPTKIKLEQPCFTLLQVACQPSICLRFSIHYECSCEYECAPFPGAQPGPGLRPLPWQHRSRARMSSGCAQRGYCARPWWGNFPWHGSATGWLWEGTALLLLLKRGQLRSSDSAHFPSGASSILGNTVIKKEKKKKTQKTKEQQTGQVSEQKHTKSTCCVLPVWLCCLLDTSPAAGTASNSKARGRARSLLATDFGLGFSKERSGLLRRWCKVWTHQNTFVCGWQSLHPAGHSGMDLRLDFKLRRVCLAETDDNLNFQGRTWVLKTMFGFQANCSSCLIQSMPTSAPSSKTSPPSDGCCPSKSFTSAQLEEAGCKPYSCFVSFVFPFFPKRTIR